MSIVRFRDLKNIRKKHKDQKIVFCSGCFDLTHAVHVLFFEGCKKLGDILVVMVGRDSNIKKTKGAGRPIFNEHVRLKIIASLKPVDYCFLDMPSSKKEILEKNLKAVFGDLNPDIYVVNDDAFDLLFRKNLVKAHNVPMRVLKRSAPKKFGEISTTKIIEKVKRLKR